MSLKLLMIGACCGNNCGPQPGGQWGPVEFFRRIEADKQHKLHGIETQLVYEHWCRGREKNQFVGTGKFAEDLANAVQIAINDGYFPIVIGGDHSCAIGTWRGVSRAHKEKLGMVWLDAHLDSHTDHTSHSGAIHGMPLAALTNNGHPALRSKSVDPRRVAHVGARSFEMEEVNYAVENEFYVQFLNNGVHLNVDKQQAMIEDAISHASDNGHYPFGLSIDLDGLDPQYAPAVSCPESKGLDLFAMIVAIRQGLSGRAVQALRAFELVEFNPCIDTIGAAEVQTTYVSMSMLVYAVVDSLRQAGVVENFKGVKQAS